MQPCYACGRENKCCIVRLDKEGVPHPYCCQCVPRDTIENVGNQLGTIEKCEVENELCCFSKPLHRRKNP